MLKMDSTGTGVTLMSIRTVRQCPLCRELMAEEDWRKLPRHETAGELGITIKLLCPECHQQSPSIQWQELRRQEAAI